MQKRVISAQPQSADDAFGIPERRLDEITLLLQRRDKQIHDDVGVMVPLHIVNHDAMLQKHLFPAHDVELIEHIIAFNIRRITGNMGGNLHFRRGAEQVVPPAAIRHDAAQLRNAVIVGQLGVCDVDGVDFGVHLPKIREIVVAVVTGFPAALGHKPNVRYRGLVTFSTPAQRAAASYLISSPSRVAPRRNFRRMSLITFFPYWSRISSYAFSLSSI